MQGFSNILAVHVQEPGSDDALLQAARLARAEGARLTVVRTIEAPRSPGQVEEARRQLSRLAPWLSQEGVPEVETEVLVGPPHLQIARRVLTHGHDLVLLSAEANRGLRSTLFGGTASNLLWKCPCAVWVVRPGAPSPCGSVLAAVDPRPDEATDGFCGRVVRVAASLARAQHAALHLVHYWDVEGREGEMLRSEIRDETKRGILARHEDERRRRVRALLANCAIGAAPQIHLPRGRPHFHLARLVDRLAVDLVVVGSHRRGGFARFLSGSLAKTLLAGVRCDLLVVKPDDLRGPAAAPEQEWPAVRAAAR